jgi:hypothetical protein
MPLTIASLDSGYDVRLRPVPPYAIHDVIASYPRPKYPMLNLQSDAGPSEIAPALEDSPEWHAWQSDQAEYNQKCTAAIEQFTLTYGVLDYRMTGSEDPWTRGAPADWHVPEIMKQYGITDSDDKYVRWFRFIRYVLVITDADEAQVNAVINQSPNTPEEIDAAVTPFDSSSE